jgi:hypothetical protein
VGALTGGRALGAGWFLHNFVAFAFVFYGPNAIAQIEDLIIDSLKQKTLTNKPSKRAIHNDSTTVD